MGKVTPIMGPNSGNKDVEHCPPTFHVDLTEEELIQALQDPGATAKRLGMEEGIDSIHISVRQPIQGDKPNVGAIYCCVKCLTNSLCCQAWKA